MSELEILLCWSICTFLLCGGLLWTRRQSGDRSRLYLSGVWILAGLAFLARLLIVEAGGPIMGRVLPAQNLGGGLWAVMALYLYPMEAICSGWLTRKRLLQFFLPGLLAGGVLLVTPPYWRELYSFADIWTYIHEFNVWFRVVILFLGIFFYMVLLFYIPYNWMKSRVYHRWILYFSIKIQLIGCCFILFMLTGSSVVSCIHLVVCMAVAVTVTYQELFIRFEMPQDVSEVVEAEAPNVLLSEPSSAEGGNPLIGRMYALLEEEQIWRNPDLDLPDLALRLNTNRSYLSKAIQESGYRNFSDMINRCRIAEFLKAVDAGQVTSVQDTFFRVGFRSRETALRCFKKYVGLSPTEYMRSRKVPVAMDKG